MILPLVGTVQARQGVAIATQKEAFGFNFKLLFNALLSTGTR
jgi:hypothetical protein